MATKKIHNPTKLTQAEELFVNNQNKQSTTAPVTKQTFKGRMISMPDDFYNNLNIYLRNNPTEGNRSSFIVRIVAEYIKNKTTV